MALIDKLNKVNDQITKGKRALADILNKVGINSTPTDQDNTLETFSSYSNKVGVLTPKSGFIFTHRIDKDTLYNKTLFITSAYLVDFSTPVTINNINAFYALHGWNLILNNQNYEVKVDPALIGDDNITISWGDGETSTFNKDNNNILNLIHTYKTLDTYTVIINGTFRKPATLNISGAYFNNTVLKDSDGTDLTNPSSWGNPISIDNWGDLGLTTLNRFMYPGKDNLTKVAMWSGLNPFTNLETAVDLSIFRHAKCPDRFFSNCSKLKSANSLFEESDYVPPTNIFEGSTNIESLNRLFTNNKNLIEIDRDFFANMPKLSNIAYIFQATNLKSIPNGLFRNNKNLVNLSYAFQNTKISGYITKDIIGGLIKVQDFSRLFADSNIEGIASNTLIDQNGNKLMEYVLSENYDKITSRTNIDYTITNGQFKVNNITYTINIINNTVTAPDKTVYNIENFIFQLPDPAGWTSETNNAFHALTQNYISLFGIFSGCTNLKGDITDCLKVLKGNNLNIAQAFMNTQVTWQKDAFDNIDQASLVSANAAFANTNIVTPNIKFTEDNYDKWISAFASVNPKSDLPLEVGGSGARIVDDDRGKLVLKDKSLVEIANYTYNADNPPVALIVTDDKFNDNLTMQNCVNSGNVDENGTRHVYARYLGPNIDTNWIKSTDDIEDIPGYTYYSITSNTYQRYTGKLKYKFMTDYLSSTDKWDKYPVYKQMWNTDFGFDKNNVYLPDVGDAMDFQKWVGFYMMLQKKFPDLNIATPSIGYKANSGILSDRQTCYNEQILEYYKPLESTRIDVVTTSVIPVIQIQ